ncbi:MAG: hypothetical protein MK234_03875 [Nitrospinales bacterium]|nr:hypothetical protein [Nitrospinales bacterium]
MILSANPNALVSIDDALTAFAAHLAVCVFYKLPLVCCILMTHGFSGA